MNKYYKKFRKKELDKKIKDIRFHFGQTILFPVVFFLLNETLNYFEIGTVSISDNWYILVFGMLMLSWQFYRKTLILEDELLGKKGEES